MTGPSTSLSPLHRQLREHTAAAHQRLESGLDLMRSPPDLAYLRTVLAGFLGFHRVWEPALAQALNQPEFTTPRERRHLLVEDLQALGLSTTAIAALPEDAAAAALCHHRAAALGSLYVLAGSTLGGKVIGRHLAGTPDLPPGGLRYFNAHGPQTGGLWAESLQLLAAEPVSHHPQVLAGAAQTFAHLHHWLTGPGSRTHTGHDMDSA